MAKMRESEMLRALLGGDDDDEERRPPRPLPEAQIATLREISARYTAGCSFAVGDLVTPRAGTNLKDDGEPHIVVEIAAEPHRSFGPDVDATGSHAYGKRLDMRVAHIAGVYAVMHWVESWCFEPYREEPA